MEMIKGFTVKRKLDKQRKTMLKFESLSFYSQCVTFISINQSINQIL